MHTSFRQFLLHTALKILAVRQHACGFLPCLQQNYARKSAYISYEDRFLAILVKFVDYLFKMNASARLEKHNIARTELEFKEVEYL